MDGFSARFSNYLPVGDVLNASPFFAGSPGFLVPVPEILPDKVHCGPTQASTSECGGLPKMVGFLTRLGNRKRSIFASVTQT
jgi:hypothetical protein